MVLPEIDRLITYSYYSKTRAVQIHDQKIGYYDITLVASGSLFYRIDGEPVQLQSTDVIVLPAGCRRYRAKSVEPAGYTSFNFTLRDGQLPLRGCYKGALTPVVSDLIRLYVSAEDPYKEEKRRHLLTAILYELVAFTERKAENENVLAIKRYIRERLSEEISLGDIAGAVHLHPAYCCGLFKKETGMTIVEYINESRVELAKKFLRAADAPVGEVPALCGFTNYKYFAKVFKRSTGLSPSAYRKKNDLRDLEG